MRVVYTGNPTTDAVLATLLGRFRAVSGVDLYLCTKVTDAGIKTLARRCGRELVSWLGLEFYNYSLSHFPALYRATHAGWGRERIYA